jgi:hypothetical protein
MPTLLADVADTFQSSHWVTFGEQSEEVRTQVFALMDRGPGGESCRGLVFVPHGVSCGPRLWPASAIRFLPEQP